jgi:hypothetical protein
MQSTIDQFVGYDDKTKIEMLYNTWKIIIGSNYALFEEWIHVASLLSKDASRMTQLMAEQTKLRGLERVAEIKMQAVSKSLHSVFNNANVHTLPSKYINDLTTQFQTLCIDHIVAVRNLADLCIDMCNLDVKHEDNVRLCKSIVCKFNALILTDEQSAINSSNTSKSVTSTTLTDEHVTCISVMYDHYGENKVYGKLIERALQLTCSINDELAIKVVKLHNKPHVLENGERCSYCSV